MGVLSLREPFALYLERLNILVVELVFDTHPPYGRIDSDWRPPTFWVELITIPTLLVEFTSIDAVEFRQSSWRSSIICGNGMR